MDEGQAARWDVRLARSSTVGPTEFRGLATEVLATDGGREYVVERFRDPDCSAAAWRVAGFDVEEQVQGHDGAWIATTQRWLEAGSADWQRSAVFCADVAWSARAACNSALLHLGPRDLADDLSVAVATPAERAVLHLLLQSQRYDFRFRAIRETVAATGVALDQLDPFSRAIHAFALLGQNADSALAEFSAVRRIGGEHEKVAHALLHGLWMATELPGQAERIIDLIDTSEVLRDGDPIVALRRAYALRKLGRYDEAYQAVDLGMLNLSPASPDIHQDFTRERSMISVVRDIEETYARERQVLGDEAARHVRELDEAVAQRAEEIEDKVAESLFKMVEILGLFTAVIALLASGAASVTIGNLEWWQRGVLMLVAGTVVMTFFVAIRTVVRPRRTRRPSGG